MSVSDARSGEGDATVVFTATLTPSNTADAAAVSPVSFRYATAAGTATAGSDYTPVSGTLTIPAGGRRATVTVQLLDDSAAESTESFTLRLTNPQGAVLSDTTATATIIDDDGPAPSPAAPATVCDGATIVGDVGDVSEVTQPDSDNWHHVLVDLYVTCGGGLSSALGYPTAVRVIYGPSPASGPSRHCLTRTGTRTTTASVAAAAGCPTFASPAPARFTRDGRSTHLLWIPDTAIGQDHQMRAWIDADSDGVLDADEPYVTFESNFASRTLAGTGFHDYEYPQHFEVDLVSGSTRVGRGGHDTELRLRLSSVADRSFVYLGGGRPTLVYPPVIHTPVGAAIISGPSHTQPIACLNTTRSMSRPPTDRSACFTDYLGEIIVRYKVPFDAIDLFAMQRDLIRIHIDGNRNGRLDTTTEYFGAVPYHTALEPVAYTRAPIAKAVNYIALGDSYSAGENGRRGAAGFVGEYQEDVGAADEECKRWDRAYPVVFKDDLLGATELGIQVEFQTFACVGAITLNVYDALDPEGMSAVPDRLETNGPSPNAQGYEDRQSVSLADVQDMGTVDMVTITIGGNDASFSTILKKCVAPSSVTDLTCNESDLEDCEIAVNQNNVAPCDGDGGVAPLSYREVIERIEERVVEVLGRIKNDAPRASVFLLGYPYLTPVLTPALEPCDGLTRREIASLNRDYEDRRDFDTTGLSDRCVYRLVVYFESFLATATRSLS